MALGSHASILSISALASLLSQPQHLQRLRAELSRGPKRASVNSRPGVAGDVSCGGHMALLCSRCVESQPAEDKPADTTPHALIVDQRDRCIVGRMQRASATGRLG